MTIIKIAVNKKFMYLASMGLIGMPGTIDKVAEENSMPLSKRQGTSKSWSQEICVLQ